VDNQELIWLEQAQGGNRQAFARLVEAYQGPVYNLAYRMLGNAAEAEDATQETFVRMYTKLHTFQPDKKLSSWVLSIASHYCIDRLRRRRGEFLSLDEEPVANTLRSGQPDPQTPVYRVPLVLRYWHDLSYGEIAEVLGLSVQAVKSRLHRARLQMAERAGAE